ncbi:glutamate racemase [Candidatus Marinarcus aquaticus]|uniref:Glutamate racemase n=1 Tax=Candidatus Marinarcus aquaticus TaxID=2044504 RepID=A0A4Q0XQW3_9BACT|nr:glutamate racemase [Candidatus Marinarcus aquaticus]RXJ56459.1 glutamate racemase [Candidatus Marinarcus aquaticus]
MKVGVFDSGIGGLTVVKSLIEHKLFEEIIYYGDTARVPYGAKDKNTIIRYSLEALEFFKNFDIDMLIVACNTASAFAIQDLKEVASIPVVGVIQPGVLAVQNRLENKESNILVIATKGTIQSNRYQNELHALGYKNINAIQTGLFVPIVEEGIFEGEVLDATLKHYFNGIKGVDAVILGCTHFPLIADKIASYLDGCQTIHSGEAIVDYLIHEHKHDKNFEKTKVTFFASENPEGLKKVAKNWLGSLLND